MSENNANPEQNAVMQAPANEKKKRIHPGFIFLSFVPVAVLFAIQTVSQSVFLALATVELINDGGSNIDPLTLYGSVMEIFNAKYAFICYLIYGGLCVTVFAIWYAKAFVKKNPRLKLNQIFGVRSVLAAICTGIGLVFTVDALITILCYVAPALIESYRKMVETSGIGNNVILTIVYGIVLGPILEELCLRGLVFGYLEKSGIRPGLIILITGLVFGCMHIIPVQVAYATLLGLFLGFLRYKYRSILIPLIAHFAFNIMGTFGDKAIAQLGLKDGAVLIIGGLSLFLMVFVIVAVNGDPKAYKAS